MANLQLFYNFVDELVSHILQSDLFVLLVQLFLPLFITAVIVAFIRNLRMGAFT